MKIFLRLAAVAIAIVIASSAFGGEIVETRQVAQFDGIDLIGRGYIILRQGEAASLSVEADSSILPLVTSEVVGTTLTLRFKPGIPDDGKVVFRATCMDLSALKLRGSGIFEATTLSTSSFDIVVIGAGSARIATFSGHELKVVLEGSQPSTIAGGSVNSQKITITGSSRYDATNLESTSATVDIKGNGQASLAVKHDLVAVISGKGVLKYFGDPKVEQKITGSGSVVRMRRQK